MTTVKSTFGLRAEILASVANGGGTFAVDLIPNPAEGYVVAVKGHTLRLAGARPAAVGLPTLALRTAVEDWLVSVRQAARRTGYVGIWADGDDLVLDVVEVFGECAPAVAAGAARGEISIYCLTDGREISTSDAANAAARRELDVTSLDDDDAVRCWAAAFAGTLDTGELDDALAADVAPLATLQGVPIESSYAVAFDTFADARADDDGRYSSVATLADDAAAGCRTFAPATAAVTAATRREIRGLVIADDVSRTLAPLAAALERLADRSGRPADLVKLASLAADTADAYAAELDTIGRTS